MPHLRFRAVEAEAVKQLSYTLGDKLSFALGCPEDYFTFEKVESSFFYKGEAVAAAPQVEIHWFERGQELKDLTAQIIHEELLKHGYDDTVVIFTKLVKEHYYDNGQHY